MISPKVMTVCKRYARDMEEARELFQECFYQLLTSLGKYDDRKGEFEGWVYRLCYYTIIKEKKNNIRFFELTTDVVEEESGDTADYPVTSEQLINEIQKLPEGYRMVLNLFVFEGLTHEEVAGCLGIGVSTSRSQLARARAILKKRLNNKNKRYATRSI